MPNISSLRWLFVRLPIDPDVSDISDVRALARPISALLVALGGIVGSLARAWIGVAVPHQQGAWPWSTVIVNVVGSGLLAFLLVILLERFPLTRIPLPLLGTGLIGGYTTFSTFAVDVVHLSHAGRSSLGLLYIFATLFGTISAAIFGLCLARAIDRLQDRRRWMRRVELAQSDDPRAERP